jgi:cytochrome c-type biogenesis protein CcmE
MVGATKILLSVAVIGGGIGMLIYSSMAEADYYKHVHEVSAEPERWSDKGLKLHGFVEAGSVDERIIEDATVRTFILEYQGERMRVRHKGPKPDTFRELSEVVAQGRLVKQASGEYAGEYLLEASELMAKCPSKYEEERRVLGAPAGNKSPAGAGSQ